VRRDGSDGSDGNVVSSPGNTTLDIPPDPVEA